MNTFRYIPENAFGSNSIVRIRDIDVVVNNYKSFLQKANKTNTICGVVLKADVHGLLMEYVAPKLYEQGCKYFFIEELSEGIELRKILPYKNAKIFAMAGLLNGEEKYFDCYNITPCLNCIEQIERWNNFFNDNKKRNAVIHLDTHMNRIGLLDDEVGILSKNFNKLTSNINIEFYMSHFFDIKGDNTANCYYQLDILKQYLSKLPKRPVSFACTDSTILLDNSIFNLDIIRIGIGLVGGAPNKDHPISPDSKGAIEVYAKLSQIKNVKKGETIGYGGSYTAKRDMKLALVHIGYKDGYLRSLSELDNKHIGAYMVIGNYKIPIVGKISLGMTTVDVTDVDNETLNKYHYAEVIGPNVDIKELADIAGCYEILASIGRINKKCSDYTLDEFEKLF